MLSETVFITSKTTRIILKELRAPLTRFLMARANTVIGAQRIVSARDSSEFTRRLFNHRDPREHNEPEEWQITGEKTSSICTKPEALTKQS